MNTCTTCGGKMIVNRSFEGEPSDYFPCPACAPNCEPVTANDRLTIQQKFDILKETVHKMRGAQKEYFATRSKRSLADAKELEEVVDRLLNSYKVPGAQQSMF